MKAYLSYNKPNQGLTLIEVLAALAFFAIIMVGISSLTRETTRLSEKISTRQVSVLAAQVALDRLQRELMMAYTDYATAAPTPAPDPAANPNPNPNPTPTPPSTPPTPAKSDTLFMGRVQNGPQLMFSYLDSPIRSLFVRRAPGIKIASYSLEKVAETGTSNLLRSEVPLTLAKDIETAEPEIIAEGLLDLVIEYYDPRDDQWAFRWDSARDAGASRIPAAVRIKMKVVDPTTPADEREAKSLLYVTAFPLPNAEKGYRR